MTMIPVTQELLEDTAGLQPLLERRLRLYVRHTIIHSGISRWLEDWYGTPVPYPPPPFDAEALRPSLPSWPRPHR